MHNLQCSVYVVYTKHKYMYVSIVMVEAKILCFLIFCIFSISWSYINIGFKNIPPQNA